MKNKVIKVWILGIILVSVSAILLTKTRSLLKEKAEFKELSSTLPLITWTALDSSKHVLSNTNSTKIIFFFSTDCDHCHKQAKLIFSNLEEFAGGDLYFFSLDEISEITEFKNTYKEINLEGINIGKAIYDKSVHALSISTYPSSFIYSPQGELLKRYTGLVKIDALTKYIE
ncbi:MAG: redoxin domain-containing protein [Saprospiraceae bacterium]|nr:redoxin domain-containing protein [Saprospiraceae bacterium]